MLPAAIALIAALIPAAAPAQTCGPANTCNQLKVTVVLPPDNSNHDTFGFASTCGTATIRQCLAGFDTTAGMSLAGKCEAIRSTLSAACTPVGYTISGACDGSNSFTATDTLTPGAVLGFKAINYSGVIDGGTQGSVFLKDYEKDMIAVNTTTCSPNDPNADGNQSDAITHQITFSGTGDGTSISGGSPADVEITVDETANGHGNNTVSETTSGKTSQTIRTNLLTSLTSLGINATAIGSRGIRIRPRAGDTKTISVGAATDDEAIHMDSRMGARDTLPVPSDTVPTLSEWGFLFLIALLLGTGGFMVWRKARIATSAVAN